MNNAQGPSDEDLILAIQNGSQGAFASLVERHNMEFYYLAYRYTYSRETAEDMVQSAFLKLWERPHMWSPDKGAKFKTWFYRVIINQCLDHKRKSRNVTLPEYYEVESTDDNQETILSQQETQKLLNADIAKLPDRQKTALILCFFEEKSQKEAAEIMKTSVKAVESLLMRAKAHLKKNIKNYTDGEHSYET